jgi:hypothetical protein
MPCVKYGDVYREFKESYYLSQDSLEKLLFKLTTTELESIIRTFDKTPDKKHSKQKLIKTILLLRYK